MACDNGAAGRQRQSDQFLPLRQGVDNFDVEWNQP